MLRPTYAEVNWSAITLNVKNIRNKVGEAIAIMPAVKADGYGHGAIETAKACIDGSANALCVATLEEAIKLRDAGIGAPILILGCCSNGSAAEIIRHQVAATICDIAQARALSDAALAQGLDAIVHIKVDTGMGRIGIDPESVTDFAGQVSRLPGLRIEGLFTHFPCADETDRSITLGQIAALRSVISELNEHCIHIPMVHAANSAGVLAYPDGYFNGVRPGIMIYGFYPSEEVCKSIPLQQALTLKTQIAFIKTIKAGQTVSYNRLFCAGCTSKIATLPIGYGDGYSRLLSNRGQVAIRGKLAPVVGRVCMDQIMIDVTDIDGVQLGDEVVLYGGGYDELNIAKIANDIGTISYEVLCNLSPRVPRVYIR